MLTQKRKDLLNTLIKLDKAHTECHWDYESNCEYHHTKLIKRCDKILDIIRKQTDKLWSKLCTSYKVEHSFYLPKEVWDYYNEGCSKNDYDRWGNYERTLTNLGIKLPK